MKEERRLFLIKLTEIGTLLVAIAAMIGGLLFLWQNGEQKLDSLKLTTLHPAHAITLGHKIVLTSVMMLIAFQIMRLLIIVFDFVNSRDWLYVGMGIFILSVIGYNLIP